MINFEQWEGFEGRIWKEEVNVRDFIQKNYTPYDGDESFLAGPTEATDKLWGALQKLQKAERAKDRIPHAVSLVNPYFQNFKNFFVVKHFLPEFCTLPKQNQLRLYKIHQFPLAFDRHLCYYNLCSTATPHLAVAFWQQGGSQGCSVSKEAL